MTTDVQQPIPQLAHPPVVLQPAPDNVVQSLTTLREACAQWTPTPGVLQSHIEANTCGAVLGRHDEAYQALGFGIPLTLVAVGYAAVCRRAVRRVVFSAAEDAMAYILCGLGGFMPGIIAGAVTVVKFGDGWSDVKSNAVFGGCVAAGSGLLMALRWLYRRDPPQLTCVRLSGSGIGSLSATNQESDA